MVIASSAHRERSPTGNPPPRTNHRELREKLRLPRNTPAISWLHHATFMSTSRLRRIVTQFGRLTLPGNSPERSGAYHACYRYRLWRASVVKILIATAATLALVTAASAADLPQRQPAPVYSEAPVVGKMPIGKYPVGKSPIGKAPVSARY
jgi:hypothetical protein